MSFFKRTWPAWILMGVFIVGGVWLWSAPSQHASGQSDFASRGELMETAKSCGPDRAYLLPGIRQISNDYVSTRNDHLTRVLPRSCVTFIMHNFIDAKATKSPSYGLCTSSSGVKLGKPIRGHDGTGSYMPCVTEEYVNSVYNSVIDVADCLNVPIKELVPKLYNESGFHVNTLGPDADGGVGQLTRQALQEVFMRYENVEGRESTLNFYLKEMAKSSKASCQRILNQKMAYSFDVPKGKRVCMIHETAADCYSPWLYDNRCEFMQGPENPLRNVLMTGIYYRSMVKSVTGVNYRAGEDVIWQSGSGVVSFREGTPYAGFLSNKSIIARLERLGVSRPNQEVVRQILVGFGFNGGIGTGQILLDNYLKAREARGLNLRREELDFQNVGIGSWALFTNPKSFWTMISNPIDEDAYKSMQSLQNLQRVQLRPDEFQKKVVNLRNQVRRVLKPLEDRQDQAQIDALKTPMIEKSEEIRREILNAIFDNSHLLSLPEFMRVGHAWQISFKRGGGAPGYLTFLANKHKQLEKEMGTGVCTAEQYLQF